MLNGAIFALWGFYDVWKGLADQIEPAMRSPAPVQRLLPSQPPPVGHGGYWSRYDLFPLHPIVNTASPFYHALHINQLRALDTIWPRPEFAAHASRFESYEASFRSRGQALAEKAGLPPARSEAAQPLVGLGLLRSRLVPREARG